MAKINVKFKKLCENAEIPKFAHEGDLGLDVKSVRMEYDKDTDTYIYYTGLACETKSNVGILGFLRSSNYKKECYLTNGVGIIDSATYRGEIQFRFKNRTSIKNRIDLMALQTWMLMPWYKKIFTSYKKIHNEIEKYCYDYAEDFAPYNVGERCGQFVVINTPEIYIKNSKNLTDTSRGEKGHGSTGT